jgi:hypothetical protein
MAHDTKLTTFIPILNFVVLKSGRIKTEDKNKQFINYVFYQCMITIQNLPNLHDPFYYRKT